MRHDDSHTSHMRRAIARAGEDPSESPPRAGTPGAIARAGKNHGAAAAVARRTAEWVAYLAVALALDIGMHWSASLPPEAQATLPFGPSTWRVLWAALGVWVVAFIYMYMERRYPRGYVVCSAAGYLLSWGWQGLRLSGYPGDGIMVGAVGLIIDLVALAVIAVLAAKGESHVRRAASDAMDETDLTSDEARDATARA